jgi:ribosome-binding protein aMBF1 (putative translation factor)
MTTVVKFPDRLKAAAKERKPRRGPYRKRRSRSSYEFYRAFGRRLRYARRQLGISEAAAAAALGFSVRSYRRYEAGKPMPNNGCLGRYAKAFNVSIDWLYDPKGHEAERPRFRLRAV